MKYWILVLALALLAGCSGPVWETVDDQQPQTPVAVWQEEAFEIRTALPEGTELVEETDGLSLYRVAETGLEIEQRVFLAWDKAAAVRLLTGAGGRDADHFGDHPLRSAPGSICLV